MGRDLLLEAAMPFRFLRAATYSHGNIMRKRAFTASLPSIDYVEETDHAGMASGRDEDKFQTTGLTPVRSELVDAPYVDEFPLVLECRVMQVHELGLHTQFIGEILDVKADPGCLDDGVPVLESLNPFMYDPGTAAYHALGEKVAQGFSIGRKKKR